jgi:hypothetical protein
MVGPAVRQHQARIIIPWQSSSVKANLRVFLEILGLIEDYCQGLLPLIVPLTLLKHHLTRYPVPQWVPVPSAARVPQQVYLYPYPKELMLRNHVKACDRSPSFRILFAACQASPSNWALALHPKCSYNV